MPTETKSSFNGACFCLFPPFHDHSKAKTLRAYRLTNPILDSLLRVAVSPPHLCEICLSVIIVCLLYISRVVKDNKTLSTSRLIMRYCGFFFCFHPGPKKKNNRVIQGSLCKPDWITLDYIRVIPSDVVETARASPRTRQSSSDETMASNAATHPPCCREKNKKKNTKFFKEQDGMLGRGFHFFLKSSIWFPLKGEESNRKVSAVSVFRLCDLREL